MTEKSRSAHGHLDNRPTLFFDARCLLCQRSVRWILRKDRNQIFLFASLDSKAAEESIPSGHPLLAMDTVILQDGEDLYGRSEAVFRTLGQLPTFWRWILIFSIFPRSWTDWAYRQIAKRRYRWFGTDDTCALPDPSQQARFLD